MRSDLTSISRYCSFLIFGNIAEFEIEGSTNHENALKRMIITKRDFTAVRSSLGISARINYIYIDCSSFKNPVNPWQWKLSACSIPHGTSFFLGEFYIKTAATEFPFEFAYILALDVRILRIYCENVIIFSVPCISPLLF